MNKFFQVLHFYFASSGDLNDMEDDAGSMTDSSATVKIKAGDKLDNSAAEGVGPIDAIWEAMMKFLLPIYPDLKGVKLIKYSDEAVNVEGKGTKALVLAVIELKFNGASLTFSGKSKNSTKAGLFAIIQGLNACLEELKKNKED